MPEIVGREQERAWLSAALARARAGAGVLVLLSGEAGVGKSRLAAEASEGFDGLTLRGAANSSGTAPYGPVVEALRMYLRIEPRGLAGCGPLAPQLGVLLPELGAPSSAPDRATLFEALRCALADMAARQPLLLVLEDLQWSDQATLEWLSALAVPLGELPVAVLAAYRSDGLPREHAMRRLRHELRRAGRLDETALGPLAPDETARLLTGALGDDVAPSLARAVHDRTQGLPFFVEELASALRVSGSLVRGRRGLELAAPGEVPVPETVRDAVIITAAELSPAAREAAEWAAVAGAAFDLELVAGLSSAEGILELLERGVVREGEGGRCAFRHALTRDALYADVPWLRRRAIHRALAEALEAAGAPSHELAVHWQGARDTERARAALESAAAASSAVHAYRDAAEAGRAALELWPPDDPARHETLARYAQAAELGGELSEAARAWRELADVRAAAGEERALADAQRHLAGVHDLRGDRDAAFAARRVAADAFAAAGCPAEAAVEHLAMANQLRLAAEHGEAVALARVARGEAERAGRLDLRARAQGLEGMAAATGGDFAGGVATVRSALALALEHDLTAVAAELYQRLSVALYNGADFSQAEQAVTAALALCEDAGTEVACVTCLAYVLRERGEWSRAADICRDLLSAGTAVFVAEGLLGAIHGLQGRLSSARRLLGASLAVSTRVRRYNMRIDALVSLARIDALEGNDASARERARVMRAAWAESDDHHYAVGALRWSSAFHAQRGDLREARACVEALSRIASESGYADALAALGQAIAETSLAEGDAETAAEQLVGAVDRHRGLDLPFEAAEIQLRAGVALARAGERDAALERLAEAYRGARRLGARPLAAAAAAEVAALGESVGQRLGARAETDGLSRRELEVMRLVAVGRTNREIAQELFLSPRTVDMHVRNILRKLDCRSRLEATSRASDLGLLV